MPQKDSGADIDNHNPEKQQPPRDALKNIGTVAVEVAFCDNPNIGPSVDSGLQEVIKCLYDPLGDGWVHPYHIVNNLENLLKAGASCDSLCAAFKSDPDARRMILGTLEANTGALKLDPEVCQKMLTTLKAED